MQENHLKDLRKHRFGASTSRVSDLDYGEWDSRMCIFNEFVGDTDTLNHPSDRGHLDFLQ